MTPKERDAMARKAGYGSYQHWLRAQHQERYRGKKSDWNLPSARSAAKAPAPQKASNFMGDILNKIPIHPHRLLTYVADKYKEATGQ